MAQLSQVSKVEIERAERITCTTFIRRRPRGSTSWTHYGSVLSHARLERVLAGRVPELDIDHYWVRIAYRFLTTLR